MTPEQRAQVGRAPATPTEARPSVATEGRVPTEKQLSYPGAFLVEHADIPPELTIAQWREQRARERREQHADRRAAARARRRALLVALLIHRP